jgi:hypothetical protein
MKDPHCRDLDQLVLRVVLNDIGDRTSLEDFVGRKVCLLLEEKMWEYAFASSFGGYVALNIPELLVYWEILGVRSESLYRNWLHLHPKRDSQWLTKFNDLMLHALQQWEDTTKELLITISEWYIHMIYTLNFLRRVVWGHVEGIAKYYPFNAIQPNQ